MNIKKYGLYCFYAFSIVGCGNNQLGARKREVVEARQQRFSRKEGQRQLESQRHMNRSSQRIQMLNEETQWGLEQAPPLGLIEAQRMLHRAPQSTTSRIVGGHGGLVSLLFLALYFSNVQGNIDDSVPCNITQAQFFPITLGDVNLNTYSLTGKDICIDYLNTVLKKVGPIAQSASLVRYNRIPDDPKNALKYKIFKNHNGQNETYVMEEYKEACPQVGDKTICTISTDYISPLDIFEKIMVSSQLSQEDKIKKIENLVAKMLSGQGKEQADLKSWCKIPELMKPAYYIIELAEQFYDWAKLKQSEVTNNLACQSTIDFYKKKVETLNQKIINLESTNTELSASRESFKSQNQESNRKIQRCNEEKRSLPSQVEFTALQSELNQCHRLTSNYESQRQAWNGEIEHCNEEKRSLPSQVKFTALQSELEECQDHNNTLNQSIIDLQDKKGEWPHCIRSCAKCYEDDSRKIPESRIETDGYQNNQYNSIENPKQSQRDGQNASPVGSEQQKVETCEGTFLIDKFSSKYTEQLNQCLKKKVHSGVGKYVDATNSSFYRGENATVNSEDAYPLYHQLRKNLSSCSILPQGENSMLLYACKKESMDLIDFVDSFLKRLSFGSNIFFQYDVKNYLQECLDELISQPEQQTP